ncbi:hypothetical protein GEMRC1_006630 [Eukaryota sp. GEM-RC1]
MSLLLLLLHATISVVIFISCLQIASLNRERIQRRIVGGVLASFIVLLYFSIIYSTEQFSIHLLTHFHHSLTVSSVILPSLLTLLPYTPDVIYRLSYKLSFFSKPSMTSLRNIIFAPIAEEFAFRLPFLVLLNSSSFSSHKYSLGLVSSIPFSLAHLHHLAYLLFPKSKKTIILFIVFNCVFLFSTVLYICFRILFLYIRL